jgi:hypothetical protein
MAYVVERMGTTEHPVTWRRTARKDASAPPEATPPDAPPTAKSNAS